MEPIGEECVPSQGRAGDGGVEDPSPGASRLAPGPVRVLLSHHPAGFALHACCSPQLVLWTFLDRLDTTLPGPSAVAFGLSRWKSVPPPSELRRACLSSPQLSRL